jgi:hypothetical protein
MFQVRRKVELLITKLIDIELFDPLFLAPVCLKMINEFLGKEDAKLDQLMQTI